MDTPISRERCHEEIDPGHGPLIFRLTHTARHASNHGRSLDFKLGPEWQLASHADAGGNTITEFIRTGDADAMDPDVLENGRRPLRSVLRQLVQQNYIEQ